MRILITLLFFVTGTLQAQFLYEIDQSILVTGESGTPLQLPWGGGLNGVQINTYDLDEDGQNDLVIFDRTANVVRTFLHQNNTYRYAPEYELLFPEGITNWLLLRDFNGDGRKDIFTGDILGIKVYINKTETGSPLQWEQFYFYRGAGLPKSPVLLTKGTTQKITLQLNFDDLPSFVDVDGDGDLDLFSPRFVAESSFEFHRNMSVERYGITDSLDFERITTTWAGVQECGCGDFSFNNIPCETSGGKLEHAGGKSLLALDIDNDGDHDILFSEGECDQLFLFRNEGTDENPVVTTAVPFPEANAMVNFPAAWYEDVDFDGIKDLIVSPNLFAREVPETNFKESIRFYKNHGTDALPTFTSAQPGFLQNEMIDVGDNAVPAFFDVDGDGDLDLFIGCYINNTYLAATIYFYENTGTATVPHFTFVTDDYLGLSNQHYVNLKPQFADITGDGKRDLVFTAQTGFTSQLYYIANTGTTTANFSGNITPLNFTLFWRDENVTLADVNNDGKPDLIIGKLNGSLEYWQNMGTASSPAFPTATANYLNLSSTTLRQNPAVATGDLNGDGKDDLVYGDQSGKLTIISNYREVTDASQAGKTEIVYNPFLNKHVAQNLGGRIWPVVANLFGNSRPQIIAGNIMGGLQVLKTSTHIVGVPEDEIHPIITVYPNPVLSHQRLTLETDHPAQVQIFTMLGQRLGGVVVLEANQPLSLTLPALQPGVYLLNFAIRGEVHVRKIVIR